MLSPDVAKSLPCWLSQFRKPTGQSLSNARKQRKKNQLGKSYSYIMSKVWYISPNLNSKLFWFHYVRPTGYFINLKLFGGMLKEFLETILFQKSKLPKLAKSKTLKNLHFLECVLPHTNSNKYFSPPEETCWPKD